MCVCVCKIDVVAKEIIRNYQDILTFGERYRFHHRLLGKIKNAGKFLESIDRQMLAGRELCDDRFAQVANAVLTRMIIMLQHMRRRDSDATLQVVKCAKTIESDIGEEPCLLFSLSPVAFITVQ